MRISNLRPVLIDQFGNPVSQPAEPVGWTDLSSTVMQNVCPPNNYGGQNYNFYTLCANVINAWNGGIADTLRNRLIIWGGGHQNYSGNEVFSLNLAANPPAFSLLTEPSVFNPNNPRLSSDANVPMGRRFRAKPMTVWSICPRQTGCFLLTA